MLFVCFSVFTPVGLVLLQYQSLFGRTQGSGFGSPAKKLDSTQAAQRATFGQRSCRLRGNASMPRDCTTTAELKQAVETSLPSSQVKRYSSIASENRLCSPNI